MKVSKSEETADEDGNAAAFAPPAPETEEDVSVGEIIFGSLQADIDASFR
jgi:hypothetical protein